MSNFKTYIKPFLIGVLLAVFFTFFLKKCKTETPIKETIKIERDTIWKLKTDTFKIQTIEYQKVYVSPKDVSKIIADTVFIKAPEKYIPAKVYRDTLRSDEIEIYSKSLVKGELLDSGLKYQLKIPTETITKTITKQLPTKSKLYAFTEIGGNVNSFSNVSLGLQYNRKGNWFIGYRINGVNQPKTTHNVSFGFELFNKRK